MDAIWQGLSGIFEVALIAGLGFFLAKKGWFWENAAKDLTRLTMTVALPPLMIHSLYANFTHDALLRAAPDLVLPFVSIFASYLAGHVLASLLHISKGRRGIFYLYLLHRECHLHRRAGECGAFRRGERAVVYALLSGEYDDVLGARGVPHHTGCRRAAPFHAERDALEAPHSAAHGIRSGRHPAPCECPHPALCDGSDEVCGRHGDADGAHGHRYPDEPDPVFLHPFR